MYVVLSLGVKSPLLIRSSEMTKTVQIGNIIYYFLNGVIIGYEIAKEEGNILQTTTSTTTSV